MSLSSDAIDSRRTVIRGAGLITALGLTARETWDAILAGETISNHARIQLPRDGDARVTQLGLIAAHEALAEAGWTVADGRTALVVGTSKGAIEEWTTPPTAAGRSRGAFGVASVASDIGDALEMSGGPRLTISAACASSLIALIRADLLLRDGEADRVLVVGTESSLGDLFTGSFQRLGVIAPPGYGCRPFDENRRGFYVAEAAAAVCLERSSGVSGVFLDGYALAGDATHLTGLDPTGGALRHVITLASAGRPVDLVHAHGTGTVVNDAVELAALDAALPTHFSSPLPTIFSHKAALGHTQGAAGLISVVLNCLMHRKGVRLPNTRTTEPTQSRSTILNLSPVSQGVTRSISLATGFGGATAGVCLTTDPSAARIK